jgi:hypothetical protein
MGDPVDRNEFETLRDLPGKQIDGDIRFSQQRQTSPFYTADVPLANSAGQELRVHMRCNPETGSKTINITAVGVGPICRLDVGGPEHPGAGREHKHALKTARCPEQNLHRDVTPRPELTGSSFRHVFEDFCQRAGITHMGTLYPPDEDP